MAVKAAIATNTKLPFLITLDADERKALFKLGPKSADFVQDASTAAANFPNMEYRKIYESNNSIKRDLKEVIGKKEQEKILQK